MTEPRYYLETKNRSNLSSNFDFNSNNKHFTLGWVSYLQTERNFASVLLASSKFPDHNEFLSFLMEVSSACKRAHSY